MSTHKLYFGIRDALMAYGVVPRPRFYLKRHPVGAVRQRLTGRGSARRFRRVTLNCLLRVS